MREIVTTNQKGINVTTSLIVAQIFGKEHKHVLRDIQNLDCTEIFSRSNFGPSEYTTDRGKTYPLYEITKDGFAFLVMGYTGEKAGQFKEKFLQEFNKREALLKSDDYILDRAMNILKDRATLLEQRVMNQRETIQELSPKAEYHDIVLQSTSSHTTTTIAKELGMSARALNKKLRAQGIIYKTDNHYVLYAKYQDKGLTTTRTSTYISSEGKVRSNINMVWTEAGREFLHSRFNKFLRQS